MTTAAPRPVPLFIADPPATHDPYILTPDAIEAPPASMRAALRRIGPGMVLAASIVGSGELIATTTLGAQVGFAALWIILVSCAIKPVVQGGAGALHHRHRPHRARGLQPRARPAPRRQLAGLGLGAHGRADAAPGRRHVRRRGAGAAPARAGHPGERLGRHLPGAHPRAAARRRLRRASSSSPSSKSASSRC